MEHICDGICRTGGAGISEYEASRFVACLVHRGLATVSGMDEQDNIVFVLTPEGMAHAKLGTGWW